MAAIYIPTHQNEETAKLDEWMQSLLTSRKHLPEYKHVVVPAYWKIPKKYRPQMLREINKLARPFDCLWEFMTWDAQTGEVHERSIYKNVITDLGAQALLNNTWAPSGTTPTIYNHVVISPNGVATTLTSATGTSAITTLSVAALPAAIANGKTLTIGYGGGTTQTVTINNSGGYSAGATSLTVNSFTPSINYPIGTALVAIPGVTDNPSSVSGSVDSGALSSGAFTAASGSGAGNRTRPIAVTFTGSGGNAGSYTEAYTSNNATIAAGTTGSHVIFPAFTLGSGLNETLNFSENA
jgi:hypothetical protein